MASMIRLIEIFFKQSEYEFSAYALNEADTKSLFDNFEMMEKECSRLLTANLSLPAYEHCVRASNLFNLLDSRGVIFSY
jgi:glycyl-tRNA synthetase alpha chain